MNFYVSNTIHSVGKTSSNQISDERKSQLKSPELINNFVKYSTDEKNSFLNRLNPEEKSVFKKALLIETINTKYRCGEDSNIYKLYVKTLQNPDLQRVEISLDLNELASGTKKWAMQIAKGVHETASVAGMGIIGLAMTAARPFMSEQDKKIHD